MTLFPVHMPQHGRVERIWKRILEDVCEVSILQFGIEVQYNLLDFGGGELPTALMWSLVGQLQGSLTERLTVKCQLMPGVLEVSSHCLVVAYRV